MDGEYSEDELESSHQHHLAVNRSNQLQQLAANRGNLPHHLADGFGNQPASLVNHPSSDTEADFLDKVGKYSLICWMGTEKM